MKVGGRGGRGSREDAKATAALSFSRDEKPQRGEDRGRNTLP